MFQDLTDIYDAMIDWPKRLAHEGPFYRQLFERHGVRSVIDVACGTGRHAAMFRSWDLRVEGADISPAMIDRARAAFGEPAGLRWAVRGFDEPIAPAEPFDAAVCVGNSLPLAADMETVATGDRTNVRRCAGGRDCCGPCAESLAFARRPVSVAEVPAGDSAPRRRL